VVGFIIVRFTQLILQNPPVADELFSDISITLKNTFVNR